MKLHRILSWFLSFVLAFFPFFHVPWNTAFAEEGVTVSNYNELKDAVKKTENTLIKLNPGWYFMDEPLILDHKVKLVGLTNLNQGETFNKDTVYDEAKNVILDGRNANNIIVGGSAMLENLTLTYLRSPPVSSESDIVSQFTEKFKDAFGEDIEDYKEYFEKYGFLPRQPYDVEVDAADEGTRAAWASIYTGLFIEESTSEKNGYIFFELLVSLLPGPPLGIDNGTVQNCRIINNYSTTGSVVVMQGGTFFGNLTAFNTTSDSIKLYREAEDEEGAVDGTDPFYSFLLLASRYGDGTILKIRATESIIYAEGLSFILNNTVAYNDCAVMDGQDGTRNDESVPILLNGQGFAINNIVYNSGKSGIEDEGQKTEMVCNNLLVNVDQEHADRLNSLFYSMRNNIVDTDHMGDIFQYDPELDTSEVIPRGFALEGFHTYFDFALKEDHGLLGMDIFFDKIPNDMNGSSRLSGDGPSLGAFEVPGKSAREYTPMDVMYVSKGKEEANDGSSWDDAMLSPAQAVINAARSKCHTVMIAKGTYDIAGRVMLYIQKDGFSGGIWGGIVLPEGMKIYGGLDPSQTGTADEQIRNRNTGENPWEFAGNASILKGVPLKVEEDNEFNPDYLGIWKENSGDILTHPDSWFEQKEKDLTRVLYGTRVITQVEDFAENSGTLVDGVNIQSGYTISRDGAEPSWLSVKKVNYVGGAGALLRSGAKLINSIIEKSYDTVFATLSVQCGGGVMVDGGTLSNCLVKNNISETSGGGVYLERGKVEDCFVENNTAFSMGGGIATSHYSVFNPAGIYHTSVKDNQALGAPLIKFNNNYDPGKSLGIGGGAWLANNVIADRVIFDGNRSKNGGDGLYVGTKSSDIAQAKIQNSLITNHSEGNNSAVFMESGSLLDSDIINNKKPIAVSSSNSAVIAGTVFWQNKNDIPAGLNVTYSAMPGGYGAQTAMNLDLSNDNSNVAGPNFVNPVNGNYRLLSNSPLIGKNNPSDPVNHDYDLVSRPQGAISDIGMFEYDGDIKPKEDLEITFDANGGSFENDLTSITKTVLSGSKVGDVKPENPTINGFDFVGYTKIKDDISTKVDDDFEITDSMTLYAYYGDLIVQKTGDTDCTICMILVCVLLMIISVGTYYLFKKKR